MGPQFGETQRKTVVIYDVSRSETLLPVMGGKKGKNRQKKKGLEKTRRFHNSIEGVS